MMLFLFLPLFLLRWAISPVGVHAATYIGFKEVDLGESSSPSTSPPTITLYLNPDQEQQQQNPPPEVDKLVLSFNPQAVRLRIKDSVLEMPVAEKEMPLMGWRTVVDKEKTAAGKGEGNYYSPTPTSVVEMSDGGGNGSLLQMQFSPTLYQNIYLVVMWSWRRKGRPEAIATVLHAVYVQGMKEEEGGEKRNNSGELVNVDDEAKKNEATTSEAEWRWEWGFLEVNSWPKPSFLLVPDDDKVAAAMQAKNELSISQRRMIKLSESDWPMGAEPSEVQKEFLKYYQTLVYAYESTGIKFSSFHVGDATTNQPRIVLYFKNNPHDDDDKHDGGGGGSRAKRRRHGSGKRQQQSKVAAAAQELIVNYLPKEVKLKLETSSLTKEDLATKQDSFNSTPDDFMPSFNDNSNRKSSHSGEYEFPWLISPAHYRRIYILISWTYPAELVSPDNKNTSKGVQRIDTVLHAWYDAKSEMWDWEWGFLEAAREATTPGSSKLVPYYTLPGKSAKARPKKCPIDLSDQPLAMRIAYPEFQLKMQTALTPIAQRGSTSIAVIHTPVQEPNDHQVTVVLHPKRDDPVARIHRFTFLYPLDGDMEVVVTNESVNSFSSEGGSLLLAGYNEFEMATSDTSSSSSSSTIFPRIFPEITKLVYIVVAWRGRGDDDQLWDHPQGVCLKNVTVARMYFDVSGNNWVHPHSRSVDDSPLIGRLCKYNNAAATAVDTTPATTVTLGAGGSNSPASSSTLQPFGSSPAGSSTNTTAATQQGGVEGKQLKQQRQPRFFFKPQYWNVFSTVEYPMLFDEFGSDAEVEKAETALGKFFEK